MIKVIRIEGNTRKVVDIQESIWQTIVNGAELPEGVTYELAPKVAINPVELITKKDEGSEVPNPPDGEIEPIQTFTKDDFKGEVVKQPPGVKKKFNTKKGN